MEGCAVEGNVEVFPNNEVVALPNTGAVVWEPNVGLVSSGLVGVVAAPNVGAVGFVFT